MKPVPFQFARAGSLEDALGLLGTTAGEARPYAGGQSIGPMLNLRLARPDLLVDLSGLEELREIVEDTEGLTVGALTVHADFEDGVVPDIANGLLSHAASGIAYRAVRNRGTLGGSLAHADPAADWPPVMMALDAVVRVRGSGTDRDVAAVDFITDNLTTVLAPGELIVSLHMRRLSPSAKWGHYKQCIKPGDFAESLGVAVVDRAREIFRVVLAGPTRPPIRLRGVEELLQQDVSESLITSVKERAIKEAVAADFVDGTDRYAVNLHGTVISRAVRDALGS